eukprot:403360042
MKEPLLQQQDLTKSQNKGSKLWIFQALLTGLMFGFANFTVAIISDSGFKALSNIGIIPYFFFIGYRLFQCYQNKRKYGTYINYRKSNFFDEFRNFKWINLVPLLGNGLSNFTNLMTITFAFQYAGMAGMNQGVVTTLNTLTSVYNVIIFYFGFNERVTVIQLVGMLTMMTCVGFISVSSQQASTDSSLTDQDLQQRQYYGYISILFALLSPLSLSVKHIFIRKFKKQYDSWDVSIDGLIFEYQIYLLIAIYYFSQSQVVWEDLLIGTIGSLFIAVGKISIALAVANGIAGPAASLSTTQVIYLTLLTTLVQGQTLKAFEIIGLICGIIGAIIISSGDLIYSKFFKQSSNKQQ